MNKREFSREIADRLRKNDIKKVVSVPKHKFFIRDAEDNEAEFVVSSKDKKVAYSTDDVLSIIDMAMSVVEDALRHGDEITIRGFGTFGLKLRAARRAKNPITGEWADVPERMVPKFWFGNSLRMAAYAYTMDSKDLYSKNTDELNRMTRFDEDEIFESEDKYFADVETGDIYE